MQLLYTQSHLLVIAGVLNGDDARVGGRQRAPHCRQAVHVLWGVLQHAVAPVGILSGKHRQGLEAAPPCRPHNTIWLYMCVV